MSEYAFPMDSIVTFDENDVPQYDRAIGSGDLRTLSKSLISNGVLNEFENLQVTQNATNSVGVGSGFVFIEGCMKYFDEATTLNIETEASTTKTRIDRVVARLNLNQSVRDIILAVVKGTASTEPQAPELTRAGGVYELGLANVYVSNDGITSISDTRGLPVECGYCGFLGDTTTVGIFTDGLRARSIGNDMYMLQVSVNGVSVNAKFNVGTGNTSGGSYAINIGNNNFTSASNSKCFGSYNRAIGENSLAIGNHVVASQDNQVQTGKWNDATGDNIFAIGCGSSEHNRENALTVSESGDITAKKFTDTKTANGLTIKTIKKNGIVLLVISGRTTSEMDCNSKNYTLTTNFTSLNIEDIDANTTRVLFGPRYSVEVKATPDGVLTLGYGRTVGTDTATTIPSGTNCSIVVPLM